MVRTGSEIWSKIFLLFWITEGYYCALATTLFVPDTYVTIQSALDSAQSGDTIYVKPGQYKEHLLWPVTNGIKLFSTEGAEKTILDADNDTGSLCGIHTGVDTTTIIRGFTFQNAFVQNM